MHQGHDQSPQYVVYCDESCHDLAQNHPFMSIGSLWLPRAQKKSLSREFRNLCHSSGLKGEVKWSKVSAKKREQYKQLMDFFFHSEEFRFRTIVVEQGRVKINRFHGRDRELAFYKFYYELLEKWLDEGNEYLILLDRKQKRDANRYTTLKTYLERYLRGKAWISDLTIVQSRQTPLAQLCDLLTGSVAASYNGLGEGGAKQALANHIASRAGFRSLRTSTRLSTQKFNIFRIQLD